MSDLEVETPSTPSELDGPERVEFRSPAWGVESPYPVLAGVVIVVAGLGLIGYTWGRVAGLLLIPLQLPYVISGGLTGLGLVLVGMTIVNITVRRQDGARRDERVEQLSSILQALAVSMRTPEDGG
jgi:hypothetical protein